MIEINFTHILLSGMSFLVIANGFFLKRFFRSFERLEERMSEVERNIIQILTTLNIKQ